MGWWEQLVTMEPPEDRWCQAGGWSDFSRSTTQVKEGTYSAKVTHPGGAGGVSRTYNSYGIGWDLSDYPDSARYCLWLYCSDVTALGAGDYIDVGYIKRAYGNPSVAERFVKADLATGWNFLSFPLSAMTHGTDTDSMRSRENVLAMWLSIYRTSVGNVDFYIDDFYISTDGTKTLDVGPPFYQVKHFKRYDTTAQKNQEYVGILEPNSFHYKRILNQVTEATFTFPLDVYDDLPELMDSVRIYRNGMCVWDGVVLRAKENYGNKTCELYCLTSSYVLQRILDLTKSSFVVLASVDTAVNIKNYVYGADGAIAGSGFKQQGFGIYDTAPCGFSSETIPEYYTIPKSEFVHPWDYITSEQDRIAFDFEIRPPFVFNYWEPQKGRDLGIKLLQDVHFKVGDREKSGHNLDTACRATSRGAGASFVDDDSDATAMNTYARLVKLLSTQAKSQTEVEAMSTAWVAEYKTPATTLDIELLSGGWIYPWGLGDTIIWIIRETEYEKRIMAFDVMVDSKGEKVKVALQ